MNTITGIAIAAGMIIGTLLVLLKMSSEMDRIAVKVNRIADNPSADCPAP
jgi:hypothetical protein